MPLLVALALIAVLAGEALAQTPRSGQLGELKQLSIEELADTDVTSASRRIERLADVAAAITTLPDQSFDAALHDPPRFGIAGELYSQVFYDQLARVLRPQGRLFHYTGTPNKKTSGRDVPAEVARRLEKAGFVAELALDGVFAVKAHGRRAQDGGPRARRR